jgi:molybdopterin-guanine dinucleotide biosynthesis protein A
MSIQAAILCGGASRRFGSDKADIVFAGSRILDHLAGLCASRNLHPQLLGRQDDPSWPGFEDLDAGAGPLSALAGAMQCFPETCQEILVLAVDLPLLAGADIDWLLQQKPPQTMPDASEPSNDNSNARGKAWGEAWAIVPQHDDRAQWAFARYSRGCLPIIEGILQQNKRALHHLGAAVALHNPTVPAITGERLLNVNTSADLVMAERWFHQRGCAHPDDDPTC